MAEEEKPPITLSLELTGSYATDFIEGMKGLGLEDMGDYMQILLQIGKFARRSLENGDPIFAPDRENNVTYTFRLSNDIMPPKMVDRFFAAKMNESYAEDSMEGLRVALPDTPFPPNQNGLSI